MWKMFINKNNKINTMKFLMAIMSVKISKLIPMVLLASIVTISFALVTSPNAFASQVQDTPIATFTYPDNWGIREIGGNGEFIAFQPVNEPSVYVVKWVFLDSAVGFSQIVNDFLQMNRADGFEVSIRGQAPGNFVFARSLNSIDMPAVGYVSINQASNSNDVIVSEYLAEPSIANQYDVPGFSVETKSSPQEVNRYKTLNDQASQIETDMRNENFKMNMKNWDNFGKGFLDDDDNSWVD
jgi:hypothetical protein